MSKTKKIEKEHYELLYIIPNNFTEEESGQIQEKVKKQIRDKGGEITFKENWGKKRLAYPINHFNHGYYGLLEFDAEKKDLDEINRFLGLLDEILRFLIIKKNKEDKSKIVDRAKTEKKEEKEGEKEEKEREKRKESPITSLTDSESTSRIEGKEEEEKETSEEEEKTEEKKTGEDTSKESKEKKAKDTEKEKKKEKKKKGEDKVDMEELDKKLDDILNTDDLL